MQFSSLTATGLQARLLHGCILLIAITPCFLLFAYVSIENWNQVESQGSESEKILMIPELLPSKAKLYSFYYWHQVTCGGIGGLYIVIGDSVIVSLMIFATVQLKLLGKEIDRLFQNETVHMGQLRKLILKHKNIIRYVEELNKNFKILFFIDFTIKSYQISLTFFNVFEDKKTPLLVEIYNLSQAVVLFLQVIIIYFQANKITIESEELCTTIYKSKWFGQPVEITRCLLIMMIRSRKSLTLDCFGIVTLSNNLSVKVVKAAYTFIILNLINLK